MTHRPELTDTGWLRVERDLALERLHIVTPTAGFQPLAPSLWPSKSVRKAGRSWRWTVTESDDPEAVLAKGEALTERWAWHRADAAAKHIHDERAEKAR
jgi:hypothetical protein